MLTMLVRCPLYDYQVYIVGITSAIPPQGRRVGVFHLTLVEVVNLVYSYKGKKGMGSGLQYCDLGKSLQGRT